ncbi:MAG: RecX family transcriptional regulator [Sphingomicrobium sp.]
MRSRQPRSHERRARPPLDEAALKELALAYVARFATSRAKLGQYLRRKLHERGWAGEADAPVSAIVEQLAAAGYIDDPAFALAKARTLGSRGFGERRVAVALRAAGIEEDDGAAARDLARDGATAAALRFAKRKRLGPFATSPPDRRESDKAFAAMIRAGHPFELAKHVLGLPPDFDAEA